MCDPVEELFDHKRECDPQVENCCSRFILFYQETNRQRRAVAGFIFSQLMTREESGPLHASDLTLILFSCFTLTSFSDHKGPTRKLSYLVFMTRVQHGCGFCAVPSPFHFDSWKYLFCFHIYCLFVFFTHFF